VVDLERITAETVAYFRALDEGAGTAGSAWRTSTAAWQDQAIDPEEDPLDAIADEEFQRVWAR